MRASIGRRSAALTLAVTGLAVAGCGSSSSSSSSTSSGSGSTGAASGSTAATPPVAVDPAVAKLVPASAKSKGTLTVAADASYPPNEFIGPDGKAVIGMDADLAQALGGVAGLKVTVENQTFDSIIPGLAAGKFDVGLSSFTDTKERQKTVDFVTYFSSGTAFYTKAAGGAAVTGLSGLCGLSVAVEKGTTQQTDAQAQSGKCTSAGKKPVNVLVFPDQNGANLAISSGRAQLGMADSPVAAYAVKQSSGQFKLAGPVYGAAPYGIAIPKKSGLVPALQAGLKALIADGKYAAILAKWGQQAGAITAPKINGATS